MVEVQGSSHKVFCRPAPSSLLLLANAGGYFLNLELTKGTLLCDRLQALGN
ncbi:MULTISPECIES: hypothetical protein [unclassified Microcoleus]|uniref:hypothetical protein n=1 Tax=unclassified Microcoleus TaxID=2642155 RepID=UPI002FD5CDF5